MKNIYKNIKEFESKKITWIQFHNYFLGTGLYHDFFIPPRKIIRFLANNKKMLKTDMINELETIIKVQYSIYNESKIRFANIKTKEELIDILELGSTEGLRKITKILSGIPYTRFYIPKKSGGFREINKPDEQLLRTQKLISFYLNLLYNQNEHSHGFTWSRSILSNAINHINKNFVYNIDIKDFFPSFTKIIITEIFKDILPNASSDVLQTIIDICTYNDSLPQGAPTSPILTNIYCNKLDNELINFAEETKCKYSRYADDITFSSDNNIFNDEFLLKIKYILNSSGFTINEAKIRLKSKNNRQEVTGIIVNQKPNIPRKYIRNIRAFLYSMESDAYSEFIRKYKLKYKKYVLKGLTDPSFHIKGKIEYIGFVRGKNDPVYLNLLNRYTRIKTSKSNAS